MHLAKQIFKNYFVTLYNLYILNCLGRDLEGGGFEDDPPYNSTERKKSGAGKARKTVHACFILYSIIKCIIVVS